MRNLKKGFTLIELIIVIAIIAILAAAIFVAVDPARRLHESRNARRWSDVTTILEAVVKHQTDNNGTAITDVQNLNDGEYQMIGTGSVCAAVAASGTATYAAAQAAVDCVDLSGIGSNYLGSVPIDPLGADATVAADATYTRYYIGKTADGALAVGSCEEEQEGPGGDTDAAPVIELIR